MWWAGRQITQEDQCTRVHLEAVSEIAKATVFVYGSGKKSLQRVPPSDESPLVGTLKRKTGRKAEVGNC